MNLQEELKKYSDIVNIELDKYNMKEQVIEEKLNSSMEYSLMAGGKRLRPILMILSYKLFKEDYENCFPFAIAMEMIHNFSLIHDDMPCIDNDDLRHGKPTNHKVYGEATALLAGDRLFNYAYEVIAKELKNNNSISLDKKIEAFNEFSHSVGRMIIGEYVDTEFEGKNVSEKYLEYIHSNKTAALIKASIRIGAILAGAGKEDIDKLTNYAEKIGLTFQIKDDILSEIGDEKVFGKPIGNDKEKKKCTYVTKYGLEKAKEELHIKTKEAINLAQDFGTNGEILVEIAKYFEMRNK